MDASSSKEGKVIPKMDLEWEGKPADFVFKTMEEIHARFGEIQDPPHRHNYFTIIWPYEVSGTHMLDFTTHQMTPNRLFFILPGQVHQVMSSGLPRGVVLLFTAHFLQANGIGPDFIERLRIFRRFGINPPLEIPDDKAPALRGWVEGIEKHFRQRGRLWEQAVGAFLKLFLIECHGLCDAPSPSPSETAGQAILQQFRDLVERHFRTQHKVADYSARIGITAGHLTDVVRELAGTSPKEFIQERLLLEARRLAIFTTLSAKEIGFELGFEDPAHFSKFFKKQLGTSLSDFRRSLAS